MRRYSGLTLVAAVLGVSCLSATNATALGVASPTTTTLASSPNPSIAGDPVTFTATVVKTLGGVPTGGSVQFLDAGTVLSTQSLVSGVAQYAAPALTVGTHLITAVFVQDLLTDPTSLSSLPSNVITQTVNAATSGGGGTGGGSTASATTTTLVSSLPTSAVGDPVTFTATVARTAGGVATGQVQFLDASTLLSAVPLSGGAAQLTTSALTGGSHLISAVFVPGDVTSLGSVSNLLTQVVTVVAGGGGGGASPSTTTTTLLSSANPAALGDPVTFTATVARTAGGTTAGQVEFLDANALLSTLPLSGGAVQFATSSLTAGSHLISAVYVPSDPTSSLTSVSNALTQVVTSATCATGKKTPTPTVLAPARIVGPQAVTVHGKAAPKDVVDLYEKVAGQPTAKVGSTTAGSTGAFAFTRNVSKQTTFAVADNGACGLAASAVQATTKVALAVTLTLKSPKAGRLRLKAATAPRVANQLARFYRVKKGGTRILLAKVATGAKGVAHKTVKARSGKRYRVVAFVAAPVGNLPGKSKTRAVHIR